MELFKVVDIKEATKIIDENFYLEPRVEKVPLSKALGRIIYKDIISQENIPGFRRSSVDGYAVKSKETAGASESIPAMFQLKGEIRMGEGAKVKLDFPGSCAYVPTGGMLPEESDCVVMIEYSEKLDENIILLNTSAYPGENVVEEDEDVSANEMVIKKGTRIRPYEIGVLSSLGVVEVEVCKALKCGIISTGDEVVEPSKTPARGQVRDINTYLLSSLVEECGAEAIIYGIYNDNFGELKAAITKASEQCDIVLVSGGSSVGKKDQTLEAINALKNSKVLVHGIAVKPGKPTLIGKAEDKIIFGLPGHPLACAVIFKTIVQHYIRNVYAQEEIDYSISCSFAINYHCAKGREEFLPVRLERREEGLTAVPVISKSGIISAFSKAYGYIRIDKNLEGIRAGEKVSVYEF
jgi:molybdopterin molybdotransferase